jgi:hypothetical protein
VPQNPQQNPQNPQQIQQNPQQIPQNPQQNTSTDTHNNTKNIHPISDDTLDDSPLDLLVCTPKVEKQESGLVPHVAKKQKLEIVRPHMRSAEFIAKMEVEQYMMEETLEGMR